MSDLFHYFDALLNTDTGAARIGYFVRLIDPGSNAVVPLYADANGTPIVSVTEHADLAQSDENGNLSFYVAPGTYHLDIYGTDAVTFILRVPNVAMTSTRGVQGPPGPPGAAGNVASSLAELKAALVTNDTMIYQKRPYKWFATSDDPADDDVIVASDDTGFWISQKATDLPAADGNTVQANLNARTGTFASRATAQLATILTDNVTVNGYSVMFDGPSAHYLKVDDEPSHEGKFQDAAGTWFELHETTVYPEMLGVVMQPSSTTQAGAIDQKAALQTAIDTAATLGAKLEYSAGVIYVNPVSTTTATRGVQPQSNTVWVGHPDFELRAIANNSTAYAVITAYNVTNWRFDGRGCTVRGERDDHTGTTGEFGMCLACYGASGVTLNDVTFRDGWGDGIYMGVYGTTPCSNFAFNNVICDRNRRNGMSPISLDGWVGSMTVSNTGGTAPECGIDFEPNANTNVLKNIDITVTSYNNGTDGVRFYFGNLSATSEPVSATIRLNSINDGNTSGGSGFRVTQGVAGVRGQIDVFARVVNPGQAGIIAYNWPSTGPTVNLHSPYVLDPNQRNYSSAFPYIRCGISVYTDNGSGPGGGINIINPTIIDPRATTQLGNMIYIANAAGSGQMANINIIDPVKLSSQNLSKAAFLFFSGAGGVSDRNGQLTASLPASASLGGGNRLSRVDNAGATGLVVYTFSTSFPIGQSTTFSRVANQAVRIAPDASSSILPGGAAGKYLSLDSLGGSVTLRRLDATTWLIENVVGTTSFQP